MHDSQPSDGNEGDDYSPDLSPELAPDGDEDGSLSPMLLAGGDADIVDAGQTMKSVLLAKAQAT